VPGNRLGRPRLVLVGVDKYRPLGLNPWLWPAGAALLGLAAAAVWSLATGRGSLDAAIEIDRRFALKERVSTAWALEPALRDTPSGQTVLSDAVAHVKRIEVGSRFAVRPGRQLLLPLIPLRPWRWWCCWCIPAPRKAPQRRLRCNRWNKCGNRSSPLRRN